MTFLNDIEATYILSGDGKTKIEAQIEPPGSYISQSQFAVVKARLHIFGGAEDKSTTVRFYPLKIWSQISQDTQTR